MVQQTLARLRRELEADDREFEDRLAAARKREEAWKRAKVGRAIKRPVRIPLVTHLNSHSTLSFRELWLMNR